MFYNLRVQPKAHRFINTISSSFVVTRQPPGSITYDILLARATDIIVQKIYRLYKRSCLRVLKRYNYLNKRLELAQEQHMQEYDTKLWSTQASKPGQMVYIDNAPLAASSADNSERPVTTSYNKFSSKVMGCFAVISVQTNTLIIAKYGIYNTDSIDLRNVSALQRTTYQCLALLPAEKKTRRKVLKSGKVHRRHPLKTPFTEMYHTKA